MTGGNTESISPSDDIQSSSVRDATQSSSSTGRGSTTPGESEHKQNSSAEVPPGVLQHVADQTAITEAVGGGEKLSQREDDIGREDKSQERNS